MPQFLPFNVEVVKNISESSVIVKVIQGCLDDLVKLLTLALDFDS